MTSLAAATMKIARAEDVRNETKLIMQPYANWERHLMPAPASIAILGELILISSKTDFSINRNPPRDGFRYIRYPDSFRACLMQVTNSGWTAFNEAHKNMGQIRLLSSNVEHSVREAVKVIVQGDDQLMQLVLPKHLQNIQDIAAECTELSKRTENKFMFVTNLIQELLEAFVNAKGSYEDELRLVRRKIAENTERQKAAEECKRMTEKSLKRMTTEMQDASESYRSAMDSMPSGWKIIGLNLVGSITDFFASLFQGVTMQIARGPDAVTANSQHQDNEDTSISITVFSKSGIILNLVNQMQSCIERGASINFDKLYADEMNESALPIYWQKQFERVKSTVMELEGSKGKPSTSFIDICQKSIGICQHLTAILEGQAVTDAAATKRLVQELQDLQTMAMTFDTQSKAYNGASSFPVTPPQLATVEQNRRGLPGQIASNNARFKVEQTRAQLNFAREQAKKNAESLQKNARELAKILAKLQNCRIQEVNFKDIIDLLMQGLEAMGQMREQWEKLMQFFQMISAIIETSLHSRSSDFVTSAGTLHSHQLSYDAKQFMKDMVYQQALYVSNIASLVNMLSGTYFEISDRFLMDRVSSLGKLMALSPSDPAFASERAKLQSSCQLAQEGIQTIAADNKRVFERRMEERVDMVENELRAALLSASDVDQHKIKKTVGSGMRDIIKAAEDQFL